MSATSKIITIQYQKRDVEQNNMLFSLSPMNKNMKGLFLEQCVCSYRVVTNITAFIYQNKQQHFLQSDRVLYCFAAKLKRH